MLCFSVHKISKTWRAPFVIEFLISKSWLCLRPLCSIYCLPNPSGPWISLSLDIGNIVHLFSRCKAKQLSFNFFLSCGAISQWRCFLLISPSTLSSPHWLRIMLHVLIPLLDVPSGVNKSLFFFQILRFDPSSFMLLLAKHYVACLFFLA